MDGFTVKWEYYIGESVLLEIKHLKDGILIMREKGNLYEVIELSPDKILKIKDVKTGFIRFVFVSDVVFVAVERKAITLEQAGRNLLNSLRRELLKWKMR